VVETVAIDRLPSALDLGNHELVSLVGGGGKTTALFELGRRLRGTRVLTTTTKMHRARTDGHPILFAPTDAELTDALGANGSVLVWRSDAGDKVVGVDPEACDRWFDLADHVVVEADGSRQRPLTAPNPFEPVVPSRTTVLVACVGSAALGRVIADQCHRPLRIAAIAGCSPYDRLTPERLARLLSSGRGLQKDQPAAARFAVVISNVTRTDELFVVELGKRLAGHTRVVAVAPLE
jgi:probable selenium-dependent hydroxylase accessory protein YqeC